MMIKKLGATLATGAVFLQALVPLASADTLSGNGAFSNNNTSESVTNTVTSVQNNTAHISNDISSNANTGGNTSSDNTGGSSFITTGGAGSAVAIMNQANINQASMPTMQTAGMPSSLVVSGNGAQSSNTGTVTSNNNQSLFQTNDADMMNKIMTNAQTGNNSAGDNTGGNSTVTTGGAGSNIQIGNAANVNTAMMNTMGANTPSVMTGFGIGGNGFGSSNAINATNTNSDTTVQNNTANFSNTIDASTRTGGNNTSDNTGWGFFSNSGGNGNSGITTGSSFDQFLVSNMANANFANANMSNGTGTVGVSLPSIVGGNGAQSNNSLTANWNNNSSLFQGGGQGGGNDATFTNTIHPNSTTGSNNVSGSTGGSSFVTSGQTFATTQMRNEANVNEAGNGLQFTLPGGLGLNFNFNLGGLFGGV